MNNIAVRVRRVVDFGNIVSFVGTDLETQKEVVIHVDYREVSNLWEAWKVSGFPQPLEYEAGEVTLSLELNCDDEAEREELSPLTQPPGSRP